MRIESTARLDAFSGPGKSGSMLLLGAASRTHGLSKCIFRGRENASGSMLLLGAALTIHRSSRCNFRGRENASGSMLLLGAALRIESTARLDAFFWAGKTHLGACSF